ncbi:MAG: glycosyltransferase family 2 protein [Lachnospiraceae bacterium]|nr:glycosyltransferase family 2 protein [Lachnospiraceae bacterium]
MISVIIPVYNTAGYLKRCIDSVLGSSYEDWELILVDDGSTDHSLFICKQYSKADCRVKYFRQEHRGVSAARNRGATESQGIWIVFVDSDDYISPDFLGTVASEEYQGQELLLFDFVRLKKGRKPSGGRAAMAVKNEQGYDRESDRLYLVECLLNMRQLNKDGNISLASPCAKAYKKSVIDRYSLRFAEDLAIYEDRLFNLEYIGKARSCTYIRKQIYYVEVRMDSAMRGYNPDFLHNDIRYQKKLLDILKGSGLFPKVKAAYYSSVLSNMADILVRGIFHPLSTRTYQEKCRQCGEMRRVGIYRRAVKYNKRISNLPRQLLLFFYRRKYYRVVQLICRTSYKILEVTGRI